MGGSRHLVLGEDATGEALEIVLVLQPEGRWLVIHAMPLRYRPATHLYRVMYDGLIGPQP